MDGADELEMAAPGSCRSTYPQIPRVTAAVESVKIILEFILTSCHKKVLFVKKSSVFDECIYHEYKARYGKKFFRHSVDILIRYKKIISVKYSMPNEPLDTSTPEVDISNTETPSRWSSLISSPYFGVVIGLAVLVTAIAWVLWYSLRDVMDTPPQVSYPSTTPSVEFPVVSSTGSAPQNETQKNADYYNSALKRNDGALCDMISQENMRIECHDNLLIKKAADRRDVSLCSNIVTVSMRYACANPLILADALEKKDQSICQKIEGDDRAQKDCISRITLSQVASSTGANISRSQCDVISDERTRSSCMDQVITKLSNTQYIQAQATLNADACKVIEDESLRSTCLDEIALKKARSTQDITLCEAISYQPKKESCISGLRSAQDEKVFIEARDKKDVSLCATISDVDRRDRCHDTIVITRATIENNPLVCDSLRDEQKKIQCRQLF